MRNKLIFFSIIAIPVFILDQLTKWLASKYLNPYSVKEIIPGFFNLILVHNKGAAFGMFAQRSSLWSTLIFYSFTLIAIIILLELLIKTSSEKKLYMISFNLILGGAIGNLYDRIFQGYVVDFLDFYIKQYHWATFNIADTFVVIGTGLLIIAILTEKESKEDNIEKALTNDKLQS